MPACPTALSGQDSVVDNHTWLHFIQAVHDVGCLVHSTSTVLSHRCKQRNISTYTDQME